MPAPANPRGFSRFSREPYHGAARVRIAERGEDLSADPKIGVAHVGRLDDGGKPEGHPSKLPGRHERLLQRWVGIGLDAGRPGRRSFADYDPFCVRRLVRPAQTHGSRNNRVLRDVAPAMKSERRSSERRNSGDAALPGRSEPR
jgi:hypothetical protein